MLCKDSETVMKSPSRHIVCVFRVRASDLGRHDEYAPG